MVKGISRQVIVVHSPDPKLFEQAIFILKDEAVENGAVTEEILMREAKRLIGFQQSNAKARFFFAGPAWACCGAMLTGFVWLITLLF